MGVTKGSFYWHFKNRADFILNLVEYWSTQYTSSIANELNSITDPAKRLLILMTSLTEGNHARYDVAMLNWGQHEPSAQTKLQEVFDFRVAFIREIFSEIGFSGDDLEMRVHTMVFFQTMECSNYTRLSNEERLRHVRLRHKMLTEQP
jgi:AcrR family transcriptional regulator